MRKIDSAESPNKRELPKRTSNRILYKTIFSIPVVHKKKKKDKKPVLKRRLQYAFLPLPSPKGEGIEKEILSIAEILKNEKCLRPEVAKELREFSIDSPGESMKTLFGVVSSYKTATQFDEDNDAERRAKSAKKYLKVMKQVAHLLFPETERSKSKGTKGISPEQKFEKKFGDLTKMLEKVAERPKKWKSPLYVPAKALIQEIIRFVDRSAEREVPRHTKTHSPENSAGDQPSETLNKAAGKKSKKRKKSESLNSSEAQLVYKICGVLNPEITTGNVSTVLKDWPNNSKQALDEAVREAEKLAFKKVARMAEKRATRKVLQEPLQVLMNAALTKAKQNADKKTAKRAEKMGLPKRTSK